MHNFHVYVRNFSGAMPRTQVWVKATVPSPDPTLEPNSENTGFASHPLPMLYRIVCPLLATNIALYTQIKQVSFDF